MTSTGDNCKTGSVSWMLGIRHPFKHVRSLLQRLSVRLLYGFSLGSLLGLTRHTNMDRSSTHRF